MNIAVILSGGQGLRLGKSTPKQYLMVAERPIIAYSLKKFNEHNSIDSIIIVAAVEWQQFLLKWIKKERIMKFKCFANAGVNRQHSVLNGMKKAYEIGAKDTDCVIFHDAARPNVSESIITECIDGLDDTDGVMPALPVKDTVYLSEDGKHINSLLNRDFLYAGQSPESFILGKYYSIQKNMSKNELGQVRGSSEIAFQNGLSIRIITGDEHNYKITTIADMSKFESEMNQK